MILKKLEKTLEFLRPTHKIKKLYDIGANLGVTCIPAVQRKMIQNAIAVEPVMQNYDILKMNIILNKLEKKLCIIIALYPTEQIMMLKLNHK